MTVDEYSHYSFPCGSGVASNGMADSGGQGQQPVALNKSNEAALLQLMERTGYSIVQENGQRKYGGPPPNWDSHPPPKGSEVFVGKIPRDCFEDELVPVFETAGRIYEFRLMMDFSGSNRGYAFVMYTSPGDAQKAVKSLNNYEIRKGKYLGVVKSVDNCRLFVGGIPKTKTKEEIMSEMSKVTEGVVNVILYSSVTDKTKSRGFAFVEYENHRAAAMARRKLIPGKIQLWGHEIAVDWAEPEPEVDEETMSKVTVLYVRNLMLNTTEDQIRDAFNSIKEDCVEKVKKLRDFAFVHFRTRDDAQLALNSMNNTVLDGSKIEVTWAKPVEKGYARFSKNERLSNNGPTSNTYSYTQVCENSACVPVATFGFAQPIPSTGRNAMGLRSPVRGRGRGAAGIRGGRGFLGYIRTGYRRPVESSHLFDIQPGMELIPVNPYSIKPNKTPVQILQDVCQKNNWGEPIFQPMQTMQRDGSGDVQLYVYKVILSAFPGQYNSFQSSKLCRTHEEAKQLAAENVLSQLGIPIAEGIESALVNNSVNISQAPSAAYPQQGRPISGASYSSAVPGTPNRNDLAITFAPTPSIVNNTAYVVTSGKLAPYEHGYYDAHAYSVTVPQQMY